MGCELDVLPMRADGIVDVDALRCALERPAAAGGRTLVALTHVQTDSSILQPAAQVGSLAKAHGALYLLDACQSVGALPVDFRHLRADFACATSRKWLRGPRGTGFLYARKASLASETLVGEPSCIDHCSVEWSSRYTYALAPDASRYELWEAPIAAHAGLALAVAFCREVGPERIFCRATALAARLRHGLTQIAGVVMRDAPRCFDEDAAAALGAGRCAHVTFEAESTLGLSSAQIHRELLARKTGTSVSGSRHTFDDRSWSRPAVVRMSPTYFNTEEEVDLVLRAVREILCGQEQGAR